MPADLLDQSQLSDDTCRSFERSLVSLQVKDDVKAANKSLHAAALHKEIARNGSGQRSQEDCAASFNSYKAVAESLKVNRYAQIAAELLNAPSGMLTMLDESKSWAMGQSNPLGQNWFPEESPAEMSICNHTIRRPPGVPFTVDDLSTHAIFRERPYVVGEPKLRAYAGVPITVAGNFNIGALCVMDLVPRAWKPHEVSFLLDISRMIVAEIELQYERKVVDMERRMQRSIVQFIRGNVRGENITQSSPALGSQRSISILDEELEAPDTNDEVQSRESSDVESMFNRAACLQRRTLLCDAVVLVDIGSLAEFENIQSTYPKRSSVLGSNYLKTLCRSRSAQAAENTPAQSLSDAYPPVFSIEAITSSFVSELLATTPRGAIFHQNSMPDALRIFCPQGAESVIVMPVYDSHFKAFTMICCISLDSARRFNQFDKNYVEAFGSSIMSEILRRALARADEAKSIFISSISHELRSPLHGVLASAEFLSDTKLSSLQRGFVETIDTCGRTLLDVINHVLDYSKLQNMSSPDNLKDSSNFAEKFVAITEIDILHVTEQVLETCYASYEFKTINISEDIQRASNSNASNSSAEELPTLGKNVEIAIDVEPRSEGWTFSTDSGAYKRIVMNLLGNALKYTKQGYIKIKLDTCTMTIPGLVSLRLTVTDTGIGMSEDFLRNHAFKPFSQEDSFATGIGLGLSIVKEIVANLHAEITVRSEQGAGTEVTVCIPMIAAPKPIESEANNELRGLNVHLLNFDLTNNGSFVLYNCLRKHLTNWYGMRISAIGQADIVIADEAVNSFDFDSRDEKGSVPLLVLCSTVKRHEVFSGLPEMGGLLNLVTKPCGPEKLGKALQLSLSQQMKLNMIQGLPEPSSLVRSPRQQYRRTNSGWSNYGSLSETNSPDHTESSYYADHKSITGGQRKSMQTTKSDARAHRSMSDASNIAAPENVGRETLLPDTNNSSACLSDEERPTLIRAPSSTHKHPRPSALNLWDNPSNPDCTDEFPETSSPSPQRKHRPHILIVEDNPINAMILITFMKKHRYSHHVAANGAFAVDKVRDRPSGYDIILMDMQMPVMNGFDATEKIREIESARGQRSFIAALTGLASSVDQAAAFQKGVDLFLTKPIGIKRLSDLFAELGYTSGRVSLKPK